MQFNYAAKTLTGDATSGYLDADTIAAARQLLREKGLFPLNVTAAAGALAPVVARPRMSLWKKRVAKSELMLLTSQLVIMCRSGVDLAEALRNVSSTCKNPTLRAALTDVYSDVAGGRSFSAAIRKQSRLFGESYVASIAAGEASGSVPDVLERLADLLGKEIKLKTTVVGALAYPVILLGVCLTVIAALMFFVLPNFQKVFVDMEIAIPLSTQILLSISGELRQRFWLWGTGAAVAGAIAWQLFWTPPVRRALDRMVFQSRFIGEVLQSLISGRLFVLMGSMLQSGVPLIDSLKLCRAAMRSICFRELIDTLEEEVLNGRSLGRVLTNSPFIPSGAAQMIGTAEGAGKLGVVMQLVGEYYEEEGQRKIQELAKLLEPLIIIVMGVVVAFVVASIMLPILDISTAGVD